LLAYLVIREDNKWSDVYKLIPGRRITVGRSPANQIVLRSEQASRYHAEVFLNEGTWTVRDLQSRNGTAVDKQRVTKDHPLEEGQEISIRTTCLTRWRQMKSVADIDLSRHPPL